MAGKHEEKHSWKEAIIAVMKEKNSAMHYADIAEQVVKQKLRQDVGATPANTVYTVIFSDIQKDGEESQFIKVGRGMFMLRTKLPTRLGNIPPNAIIRSESKESEESLDSPLVLRSMGLYWQRARVDWAPVSPRLWGQQVEGSIPIDFAEEIGVYLLYDGREVIYVGQVVDQTLAKRLRDHGSDRLNGRWDRFSWFGILGVNRSGRVDRAGSAPVKRSLSPAELAAVLEAILIEALEPRQNRKRGQDLQAIEYLQVTDPELERKQHEQLLTKALERVRAKS